MAAKFCAVHVAISVSSARKVAALVDDILTYKNKENKGGA